MRTAWGKPVPVTAVDRTRYSDVHGRAEPWGPRHRITHWTGDKWDRQAYETPSAYQAFLGYLHLGPRRTLGEAARQRGERRGGYSRDLSSRFRWRERAAAYDEYMDRILIETERAERKAMVARHLAVAVKAQETFAAAFERLTVDEAHELILKKPGEAWRLFEGAVRLERESRALLSAEQAPAVRPTHSVWLARALMANPEAQAKALEAFDLVAEEAVAENR